MKNSAIKSQNNQTMPSRSRLWTPHRLPHLIAWHSVRTLQNLAVDDQAEFFYDVSGNGNALRQTTEVKRPTVAESSDFGNLKILEFVAAENNLLTKTTPPDSLDIGTGDFFFCCACKVGSYSSNNTIMSLQRESDDELRLFINNSEQFIFRITGSEIAQASTSLENTVNLLYAERINGTMRVFVNGTVGSVTDTSSTDITSNTAVVLGALNTSSAQDYTGEIAEVVYGGSTSTGIMNDKRRQLLEGYMAHRCNISSRLVSTHPYKYGPPRV